MISPAMHVQEAIHFVFPEGVVENIKIGQCPDYGLFCIDQTVCISGIMILFYLIGKKKGKLLAGYKLPATDRGYQEYR
jgi:hypothetical protein